MMRLFGVYARDKGARRVRACACRARASDHDERERARVAVIMGPIVVAQPDETLAIRANGSIDSRGG